MYRFLSTIFHPLLLLVIAVVLPLEAAAQIKSHQVDSRSDTLDHRSIWDLPPIAIVPGGIFGYIYDAFTGLPITSVVNVSIRGSGINITTQADEAGLFDFPVLPEGLYFLHVMAPEHIVRCPLRPISLRNGSVAVVEIAMINPSVPPPPTVRGRIIDELTGFDVIDAQVTLRTEGSTLTTLSCPDGAYTIEILNKTGLSKIELEVLAEGFEVTTLEETIDTSEGADIDIVLTKRAIGIGSIVGRVLEPWRQDQFRASRGSRVELRGPLNLSTIVDGRGEYLVDTLLAGTYTVTTSTPPFNPASRQTSLPSGEVVEASFTLTIDPGVEAPKPVPTADIDGNGRVDAVDVQLAINAALGIPIEFIAFADVNGDNLINAVDVQLVINAALGIAISP